MVSFSGFVCIGGHVSDDHMGTGEAQGIQEGVSSLSSQPQSHHAIPSVSYLSSGINHQKKCVLYCLSSKLFLVAYLGSLGCGFRGLI